MDFLDRDQTTPKVTFSEEALHLLSRPWERSLFVKLLGKSIQYQILYRRIHALWKLRGELEVLGLDYNFFLVRLHA